MDLVNARQATTVTTDVRTALQENHNNENKSVKEEEEEEEAALGVQVATMKTQPKQKHGHQETNDESCSCKDRNNMQHGLYLVRITKNDLHPYDVLLGRGRGTTENSGNWFFRCLVWEAKEEYRQANKARRVQVAYDKVLRPIQDMGGRILQKYEKKKHRKRWEHHNKDNNFLPDSTRRDPRNGNSCYDHGKTSHCDEDDDDDDDDCDYVIVPEDRALEKARQALRERKTKGPPKDYRKYRFLQRKSLLPFCSNVKDGNGEAREGGGDKKKDEHQKFTNTNTTNTRYNNLRLGNRLTKGSIPTKTGTPTTMTSPVAKQICGDGHSAAAAGTPATPTPTTHRKPVGATPSTGRSFPPNLVFCSLLPTLNCGARKDVAATKQEDKKGYNNERGVGIPFLPPASSTSPPCWLLPSGQLVITPRTTPTTGARSLVSCVGQVVGKVTNHKSKQKQRQEAKYNGSSNQHNKNHRKRIWSEIRSVDGDATKPPRPQETRTQSPCSSPNTIYKTKKKREMATSRISSSNLPNEKNVFAEQCQQGMVSITPRPPMDFVNRWIAPSSRAAGTTPICSSPSSIRLSGYPRPAPPASTGVGGGGSLLVDVVDCKTCHNRIKTQGGEMRGMKAIPGSPATTLEGGGGGGGGVYLGMVFPGQTSPTTNSSTATAGGDTNHLSCSAVSSRLLLDASPTTIVSANPPPHDQDKNPVDVLRRPVVLNSLTGPTLSPLPAGVEEEEEDPYFFLDDSLSSSNYLHQQHNQNKYALEKQQQQQLGRHLDSLVTDLSPDDTISCITDTNNSIMMMKLDEVDEDGFWKDLDVSSYATTGVLEDQDCRPISPLLLGEISKETLLHDHGFDEAERTTTNVCVNTSQEHEGPGRNIDGSLNREGEEIDKKASDDHKSTNENPHKSMPKIGVHKVPDNGMFSDGRVSGNPIQACCCVDKKEEEKGSSSIVSYSRKSSAAGEEPLQCNHQPHSDFAQGKQNNKVLLEETESGQQQDGATCLGVTTTTTTTPTTTRTMEAIRDKGHEDTTKYFYNSYYDDSTVGHENKDEDNKKQHEPRMLGTPIHVVVSMGNMDMATLDGTGVQRGAMEIQGLPPDWSTTTTTTTRTRTTTTTPGETTTMTSIAATKVTQSSGAGKRLGLLLVGV